MTTESKLTVEAVIDDSRILAIGDPIALHFENGDIRAGILAGYTYTKEAENLVFYLDVGDKESVVINTKDVKRLQSVQKFGQVEI